MILYRSDLWFILFAKEISSTKNKIPATIPNCNNTSCILIHFLVRLHLFISPYAYKNESTFMPKFIMPDTKNLILQR
jgi:hypothetical protein